ncbi:hypothetical protein I6A94_42860, partial [Frankia sp. CN4]|nr:hypothetical protein [Frankia nepalensis]
MTSDQSASPIVLPSDSAQELAAPAIPAAATVPRQATPVEPDARPPATPAAGAAPDGARAPTAPGGA